MPTEQPSKLPLRTLVSPKIPSQQISGRKTASPSPYSKSSKRDLTQPSLNNPLLSPHFLISLLADLKEVRTQHISDLRVLLDKSAEREAKLAGMLEVVIQERHYRPLVSPAPTENSTEPLIAPEHMQDVTVFDEAEDAAQIADGERELQNLIDEQRTKGITKPEEVPA